MLACLGSLGELWAPEMEARAGMQQQNPRWMRAGIAKRASWREFGAACLQRCFGVTLMRSNRADKLSGGDARRCPFFRSH
jgi:hypothetical protein